MSKFSLILLLSLALIFCSTNAKAQFILEGDEAFSTEWFQRETQHYKLIYPKGGDSLAIEYGQRLEQFWENIGVSAGFKPNQYYRKKMPIILHNNHGISNGMVVWSPRRMSLYTLPMLSQPGAIPWVKNLAVHESRHVSQMQFGKSNLMKYPHFIVGELFSSFASILYPNLHLLEGDAVVAETALTTYGRGREADFLSYYLYAFDNKDFRSWNKWRYGSYRHYSPNHYALGYLTVSGARYCYDDPLFMKRYFQQSSKKPWRFFNMQRTMKEASGKNFEQSFQEICHKFLELKKKNMALRAPFQQSYRLSAKSKFATIYKSNCLVGDSLYSLKSAYNKTLHLVRIDSNGRETKLLDFSPASSDIVYANGKLYWSEPLAHIRWGLKMYSDIRYYDLKTRKTGNLTSKGRFFNPSFSSDKSSLIVIEIPDNKHPVLSILDSKTAKVTNRIRLADSLQAIQAVFLNKDIIFIALSDKGAGLYKYTKAQVKTLIPAQSARMNDLKVVGSKIYFSSDRNGAMELYSFDTQTHTTQQISSLRYGASSFCIDSTRRRIYFSASSSDGKHLYYVNYNKANIKTINYADVYEDPIAQKLSLQEKVLAKQEKIFWADSIDYSKIQLSPAKRHRGLRALPKLHSWLPCYIKLDKPTSLDFNQISKSANLGAVLFFQNELGNVYGNLSYKYAKNPYSQKWRNSLHTNLTYTGLYPVININLSFGERQSMLYKSQIENNRLTIKREWAKSPSLNMELLTYIPLNFSSSSFSRGIIPYLSYSFSNDQIIPIRQGEESYTQENKALFLQNIQLGIKLYSIQQLAKSIEWPAYGFSTQLYYQQKLSLDRYFNSSFSISALAFIPGVFENHRIRLSSLYQQKINKEHNYLDNFISQLPRAYKWNNTLLSLNQLSSIHNNLTMDYSIPIYLTEIDLSPIAYIKNFLLIPHIDFSQFFIDKLGQFENIASAGSEFNLRTSNFLIIPIDCSIGLSYSYNFGSLFKLIPDKILPRHHFSLVFRVAL